MNWFSPVVVANYTTFKFATIPFRWSRSNTACRLCASTCIWCMPLCTCTFPWIISSEYSQGVAIMPVRLCHSVVFRNALYIAVQCIIVHRGRARFPKNPRVFNERHIHDVQTSHSLCIHCLAYPLRISDCQPFGSGCGDSGTYLLTYGLKATLSSGLV